jgi:hypothetical protein
VYPLQEDAVILATASSAPAFLENGYYHTADAFGGTGKHLTSWLRASLGGRNDPSPVGGRSAHKVGLMICLDTLSRSKLHAQVTHNRTKFPRLLACTSIVRWLQTGLLELL